MMITSLGPINPYLAEAENRSEIEYSILFTCRAIGFLIGALSVHLFEDKLSLHQLLVLGISIMGVCSCFIIFW
jgi:fucose permease